ncbi:methyltransferase family protein [Chryseobacterium sp. 3008163]|uniref:methyltransferase family protein n=1 Tax=Chryseobacterium sp. 3008163 TaxID=2478663 RepID=UPI000F0CFA0C|nr:isoprenylcysteine carboxylmethyltransferase family protein [Chryseobacterium sp. 3008163]AYN00771.1 isoprenylcysteine carboxylmethyltransferase family protein [Chryseobacterium sp. 3008163]
MNALYLLFYVSIAVWFLSEIYYKQKFKSEKKDQKKDQSTLNILWVVILPSVFLAVTISKLTTFPIRNQYWILYLGEILMVTGIFFRWMIIRSLGKFFTVDVSIKDDHQIKKEGFYRWVRHPSYSFALLTFFGFGLFLNNWFSLFIAFVPTLLAFLYRIKVEEQALIEQFGTEYSEYKKKTKKLIPFIF